MRQNKKLLVIVPCYNEQNSIGGLIKELSNIEIKNDLIVIDDGSIDQTYIIASKSANTINLNRNMGIGVAVQTGIKYAKYNDYDLCIQIDGDGQHDPNEIIKLINEMNNNKSSIVIGSRYLDNKSFKSTFIRRKGTYLIASLINMLFTKNFITDPTSGMRLMDKKAINLFSKKYPRDYPEPISLCWALKKGLVISEVSVSMRSRKYGYSSIRGFKIIGYMFKVLVYILIDYLFLNESNDN